MSFEIYYLLLTKTLLKVMIVREYGSNLLGFGYDKC